MQWDYSSMTDEQLTQALHDTRRLIDVFASAETSVQMTQLRQVYGERLVDLEREQQRRDALIDNNPL
jgi:hypothetical protein